MTVAEERWLRLSPRSIADAIELGYQAGNLHWRIRYEGEVLLVALQAPVDDYLARLGDLTAGRRVVASIVAPDEGGGVTVSLLTALQHADSAFPGGSFAFSNGFEGLAAHGVTLDETGLSAALEMVLRHRWAGTDRIAVARAWRAGDEIGHVAPVDAALEAASLSRPMRAGSRRNGAAFLAAHARIGTPGAAPLRDLVRAGRTPGHLAVAQGFLWRGAGVDEATAVAMSGYATASGLTTVAVRLGQIGAIGAQRVLAAALACVAELSSEPVPRDAAFSGFVPFLEIAATRQERAEMRLFVN